MNRFEIWVTKRSAWYYYHVIDHLTDQVYRSSKGYNSEGGAKEAAILMADQIVLEQPPSVYYYGPEL